LYLPGTEINKLGENTIKFTTTKILPPSACGVNTKMCSSSKLRPEENSKTDLKKIGEIVWTGRGHTVVLKVQY
jgi:hypothetical protein